MLREIVENKEFYSEKYFLLSVVAFVVGIIFRYFQTYPEDTPPTNPPPPPKRHTPPSSALKITPGPKSNCLEQVICIPEYTGVLHTSSLAGRLNKQDILCTKSPGDLYQAMTQLRNESPRGVHTIFVSSVMEVLPTFIIPLLRHFTI